MDDNAPASMITVILSICYAALIAAIQPPPAGAGGETLDLCGSWRLSAPGFSDTAGATVPGCVHTDLAAAGMVPDPYFESNEDSLRWIEGLSWKYSRRFDLPGGMLDHERVDMVFEGLDTHASVYLNGTLLLESDNMFRRYRVPCRGLLKAGGNSIAVVFEPAADADRRAQEGSSLSYPGGSRVFSRKAAYHYGWDWAPRFVTCGIWRPVRLEAWSGARVADAACRIDSLSSAEARLAVDIEIESVSRRSITARASAYGPGGAPLASQAARAEVRAGLDTVEVQLTIPDPVLWQPRGRGGQPLYKIRADLLETGALKGDQPGGAPAGGVPAPGAFEAPPGIIDSRSLTTGLRTVSLVTRRDSIGESFYFRVNGEPVYMKGANWVPLDCFLPGVSPARYRRALESAAAANMNMLRVWGGGIYEDDLFYDLCDSLGIMVWQDFMFACAMYPGTGEFLDNVRREAAFNLRRLRRHPCMALWCGNNEIDEAWRNWGWRDRYTEEQAKRIWKGYEALFKELLPGEVKRHSPGMPYVPTSPRYGRADPRSMTEGDSHYWGVWHDEEPPGMLLLRIPRFMSEFGIQSYPSVRTIESFTSPEARRPGSAAMRAHQKHPRGEELISRYINMSFGRAEEPDETGELVYLSQLSQARAIGTGLRAQRRAAPRCMGSLYWQLGDCWPAVSWSSIDYLGEWKALQYEARRAFDDLALVTTWTRDGDLEVTALTDRAGPVAGELTVRLVDIGGKTLWSWSGRIGARALKEKSGRLEPFSPDRSRVLLPADAIFGWVDRRRTLLVAELVTGGGERRRSITCLSAPKHLDLEPVCVEIAYGDPGPPQEVVLTADRFAFGVELSLEGIEGRFTDNYFDMLPGDTVRVGVLTGAAPDEVRGAVRVRSLVDTYTNGGKE